MQEMCGFDFFGVSQRDIMELLNFVNLHIEYFFLMHIFD